MPENGYGIVQSTNTYAVLTYVLQWLFCSKDNDFRFISCGRRRKLLIMVKDGVKKYLIQPTS